MTIIRATGTSEQHYPAERATITVHVSIERPDRSTSIAAANAQHNALVERAKALRASGDATWHQAHSPSTSSFTTIKPGTETEYIVVHRTSSNVQVKLANLDLVGELVLEFAEAELGTSVAWTLTEESRRDHERRARRDAVLAARAVADDYAEALGSHIVRVATIDDTEGGFAGPTPRGAAMFAAGASSALPAEITVPEITVTATLRGEYETAE